jgi:DNA repair exonuclease SbcCD ATPase subunit
MISLEQVRALEERVEKAVAYIAALREENAELHRQVGETQSFIDEAAEELGAAEAARDAAETRAAEQAELVLGLEEKAREYERNSAELAARIGAAEGRARAAEARVADLAARTEEFRRDQSRIEEGIVHALQKLDSFEDVILGGTEPPDEKPPVDGPSADKPAAKNAENELDIF